MFLSLHLNMRLQRVVLSGGTSRLSHWWPKILSQKAGFNCRASHVCRRGSSTRKREGVLDVGWYPPLDLVAVRFPLVEHGMPLASLGRAVD